VTSGHPAEQHCSLEDFVCLALHQVKVAVDLHLNECIVLTLGFVFEIAWLVVTVIEFSTLFPLFVLCFVVLVPLLVVETFLLHFEK
jgi:hypothetical protein